jgi:ribosomal protein S18 acetylase RimI-like enzyme
MDSDLGIIVRDAVLADLDSIQETESVFGEEAFERRTLRRFILSSNPVLIIEDSDKLVGYAILVYRRDSQAARLYSLAIREPGKGYGRYLLSRAIDRAREDCKSRVTLEVKVNNGPAIGLYCKFGFTIVKVLTDYYDPGDGYRMALEL